MVHPYCCAEFPGVVWEPMGVCGKDPGDRRNEHVMNFVDIKSMRNQNLEPFFDLKMKLLDMFCV